MFKIEYFIVNDQFKEIDHISEEEIQYDFLLGNIYLISDGAKIRMEWGWIPILDFAYSLKNIVNNMKSNVYAEDHFEFTENTEILKFIRYENILKINASFSPVVINSTFIEFENAINNLNLNISNYIRKNITNKPSLLLQKYLTT